MFYESTTFIVPRCLSRSVLGRILFQREVVVVSYKKSLKEGLSLKEKTWKNMRFIQDEKLGGFCVSSASVWIRNSYVHIMSVSAFFYYPFFTL